MTPAKRLDSLAAVLACALIAAVTLAPGAESRGPRCGGKAATIVGSARGERLHGTAGRDVIVAGGGNDRVLAGGGRDVVCGGAGGDRISGGAGRDKLIGDGGVDRIGGGAGADRLVGGADSDRMRGGAGADVLVGGRGGDKLNGGGGSDHVLGGRGGDRIGGGPGARDVVDGGLGDDLILGGGGDADSLIGGMGNDRLNGGPGDRDVVRGDDGNDLHDGGPGRQDAASFVSASDSGVVARLGRGTVAGAGDDRLARVEDLIGSGFGDQLYGDGGPNRLDGGGYNDIIRGGGGNDEAFGGTAYDNCEAEIQHSCEGRHPYDPSEQPTGTWALLEPRLDGSRSLVVEGSQVDSKIHVSHSGSNWVIRDPTGVDLAVAPDGSCAVVSPTVIHCPGPARLPALVVRGGFLDPAAGYFGNDLIVIDQSAAKTPGFLSGGWGGSDVIRAAGADDQLEGGKYDDYGARDRLYGGGGSDGLVAYTGWKGGADLLDGGPGADLLVTHDACAGDVFRGGPGNDNASFARVTDGVIARLGGTARVRGRSPCKPTLIRSSIESLEGSHHDDILIGDGGANQLMGQLGHDRLLGGGGIDYLLARDGVIDIEIDCGPGSDAREHADADRRDPAPSRC